MKHVKKPKDGPLIECPSCGGEGLFMGSNFDGGKGELFVENRECVNCEYTWDNVFKLKHVEVDDHAVPTVDEIVKGIMGR